MIKKLIMHSILIVFLLFISSGCTFKNSKSSIQNDNSNNELNNNISKEVINVIKAIIDNKEYIINIEDNEATRSLIHHLPLQLDMSELNGNEKYIYLDYKLPTDAYNPNHINKGDVMLFGDNCLVIFYKSFDTSYSYTKIGHIDDLSDLGHGDISVKLEKYE